MGTRIGGRQEGQRSPPRAVEAAWAVQLPSPATSSPSLHVHVAVGPLGATVGVAAQRAAARQGGRGGTLQQRSAQVEVLSVQRVLGAGRPDHRGLRAKAADGIQGILRAGRARQRRDAWRRRRRKVAAGAAAGLQRAGAPRCCLAPYSALLRDASQHQCGGCKCPRRECRQVVPRAVRPAQFHAVIWPSPSPCIAQPRGSPTEETQGTDAWAAWQPSVAAATQKWIGCPFRCLGAAITHSPLKKLPCFSLYPLPRETDVPVPFQTCCLSVK